MVTVSLCKKHGVSRKWFYKWKKRRDELANEGLKSRIRAAPKMPNCVFKEVEYNVSLPLEQLKSITTRLPMSLPIL